MNEQIKACPFCEGEMFILNWENNHNEVVSTSARCKNCSTTVESLSLTNRNREESIQAWNHRPIEDKLQARIDDLERVNAILTESRNEWSRLALLCVNVEEIKKLQKQLDVAEECLMNVMNDNIGFLSIKTSAEIKEYFKFYQKGEVE